MLLVAPSARIDYPTCYQLLIVTLDYNVLCVLYSKCEALWASGPSGPTIRHVQPTARNIDSSAAANSKNMDIG